MKLTLGIDLGTTKAAAVIVDEKRNLLAVTGAAHNAALATVAGGAEQDVAKIFVCVENILNQLPENLRRLIAAVGITGQMHSVLLGNISTISPLVTWQDHRCGETMIAEFQQKSGRTLREGFGGTTLARLAEKNALKNWDFAATVSDYLASVLTGNDRVFTDPTHAASWGLYDAASSNWDFKAVDALNIPRTLLPEIRPCGAVIGKVCDDAAKRFAIPAGIPVINAIGDNQASILASGNDFSREIYLTLGTGAQLSLVIDVLPPEMPEEIEARPFPGNRTLLVAAPLCGGAAFAWLADTVNTFRRDLGEPELPKVALLDKLDELALSALENGEEELVIAPHFLGERWNPALRGSCDGLSLANATPGKIGAALALGIVRNLKAGFALEVLAGKTQIIGSGNAVRLLKSIQWAIRHEFGLDLLLSEAREEAAVGAALQAQQF